MASLFFYLFFIHVFDFVWDLLDYFSQIPPLFLSLFSFLYYPAISPFDVRREKHPLFFFFFLLLDLVFVHT